MLCLYSGEKVSGKQTELAEKRSNDRQVVAILTALIIKVPYFLPHLGQVC